MLDRHRASRGRLSELPADVDAKLIEREANCAIEGREAAAYGPTRCARCFHHCADGPKPVDRGISPPIAAVHGTMIHPRKGAIPYPVLLGTRASEVFPRFLPKLSRPGNQGGRRAKGAPASSSPRGRRGRDRFGRCRHSCTDES